MHAPDVVVVGGGLAGLSSAYTLARAGVRVTLVERDAPGSGASGAAAGMLAAQHEPEADGPFYRLCVHSRDLWPELAGDLLAETGVDVELARGGIVSLADTPDAEDHLGLQATWQAAGGQAVRWWTPAAVQAHLPGAAATRGALWAVADGQVEAPRAVQALHLACVRRGVTFHVGTQVLGFQTTGRRVVGVDTTAGPISAGTVVLAAGVWSGALASWLGVRLPMFPVKGQMLALRPDGPGTGPWTARLTPVYGSGCYLVPKRDGRVVVGATAEPEAGFDRRVTVGAVARLGQAAAALIPDLERAPLVATWSGLRPGTPDRLPHLGPLPGWEGVVAATGHFRNGVLLTPVTGQVVADLCTGRTPAVDLQAFDPGRFAFGTAHCADPEVAPCRQAGAVACPYRVQD